MRRIIRRGTPVRINFGFEILCIGWERFEGFGFLTGSFLPFLYPIYKLRKVKGIIL